MTITSYVTEQCAFEPAVSVDMTNEDIYEYFNVVNFHAMFGEISNLPYTFSEMADEAIRLRDAQIAANANADED